MTGDQANRESRPRICQVMLARGFGGAERLFVDLVSELIELDLEVLPICHPEGKARTMLNSAGIGCASLRTMGWWDPIAPGRIRQLARKFNADIIHSHLARATYLAARAKSGVPLIASLHNYGKSRYYRMADRYITITRDGARHLQAMAITPDKITVIPNFSRIPAVTKPAKNRHDPPKLLAYGRFVDKKGFADLIAAMALLKERGIAFTLQLGGDGELNAQLRSQVKAHGLSDRVIFTGWLNDVAAELDCCDLFVLPSRSEPFGIVALEAMARGVPIITTRTEGPSEVLAEDAAYFTPIGDPVGMANSIGKALSNPEQRYEKAAAALSLYNKQYTSEQVIPQILRLYESVAGNWIRGSGLP